MVNKQQHENKDLFGTASKADTLEKIIVQETKTSDNTDEKNTMAKNSQRKNIDNPNKVAK